MAQTIGKYVVEGRLGAGGFGEVYLAIDPDLQKRVAIKKLKAHGGHDGEGLTDNRLLFTKEARDTSKLSHANVVTVHGFGVDELDGGTPYLVMEYLEGVTLQEVIRSGAPMTMVEKIEIMHQVAEGLQFAHTRDVIHRDIKPANIMILPDRTAKVMDFAVAPEGYIVGTPTYMAPEQFAGHPSDILTDVFSYGAVYYEFLTGKKPFDPDDPSRSQRSTYQPPRVASLVADCPLWLDAMIARLIVRSRDERMDSLEEMLVETRPTLQKLKQQRAAELAQGIAALMKAEDRAAAEQLINQVLRLDPLNHEGRLWRSSLRDRRRQADRSRAQELLQQGRELFAAGQYQEALRYLDDSLVLDVGNAETEKLAMQVRLKIEDARMAQLLVDEVLDEFTSLGREGIMSWHIESAFQKLTRASRLDPGNAKAARMRGQILPRYEEVVEKKSSPQPAAGAADMGDWMQWYEGRLKEAAAARRRGEYDYAEEILRKLLPNAPDAKVSRELNAVAEDRAADIAAHEVLRRAAEWERLGDLDSAKRQLDAFAERFPRRSGLVQERRSQLEVKLAGGAMKRAEAV